MFVEPGLGWVPWWLYIVDDMRPRQGYEFPAITELPSHYFRRNMFLTFIDEPDAVQPLRTTARHREHHVVDRLPAPGVELAELARDRRRRCSPASPPHERELIVSGNAARVWNL